MSKPASYSLMARIHRLLAEEIEQTLEEALRANDPDNPGMPMDAATRGSISKFLKDNEITCDPQDKGSLENLQRKFSRASQSRVVKSVHGILEEAQADDYPLQ